MALREILAHFGVEVDASKLEKFDLKLGEVTEKLKMFSEVIAASIIGERMHAFIEEQIQLGDELQDTSERLGITTDELQKFQLAAKLSGASAEEAQNALRLLNRNLGEAASGSEEAAKNFSELHIAIKNAAGETRPALEVIADLADKIKDLDHAKATAVAMKVLGRGGAAMIPMLKGGSEEVQKLYDQFELLGGGMSTDFTERANAAEHASVKMKFAFMGLKSRIAQELIPGFQRMQEKITGWVLSLIKLSKETNILKTAISALKLGTLVAILMKIKSLMTKSGMSTMDLVRAFFKFGPILLLVGALFLLFDDFYTMMTGGESVIGDIIELLFGIGSTQGVIDTITDAWESFIEYLRGDGKSEIQAFARDAIGGLIIVIDALITSVRELGYAFKFAWDAIGGKLTDADKDLAKMGQAMDGFESRADKIRKWMNDIPAATIEAGAIGPSPRTSSVRKGLASYDSASYDPGGKAGGSAPISIVNNITGVSDPKEAAKHAGKMTKEGIVKAAEMRAAMNAVRVGT